MSGSHKGSSPSGKMPVKVRLAPYLDNDVHRQLMNVERAGTLKRSALAEEALFDHLARASDYQLVRKRLATVSRQLVQIAGTVELHAEVFNLWLLKWLQAVPLPGDEGRQLREERAEKLHAKIVSRLWTPSEDFVTEQRLPSVEGALQSPQAHCQAEGHRTVRTEMYLPSALRAELRQFSANSPLTESKIVSEAMRQYFDRATEAPELIAGLNNVNRQGARLNRAVHNSAKLFDEWLKLWLRTMQLEQGAAQQEQVSRAQLDHERLLTAAKAKIGRGEGLLHSLDARA